jgi:hypothetical protein
MTAKTSGKPQTRAPKYHRLTAENRSTILAGTLWKKSAGEIAGSCTINSDTFGRG